MGKTEVVTGHIVVIGFIGSHLTDRLLADGHTVVAIDSFANYFPRALKEANLEGARVNPAFTLHEANILELAAEAAPGGLDGGVAEASALAALLRDVGLRRPRRAAVARGGGRTAALAVWRHHFCLPWH